MGVDVNNEGADGGLIGPMYDQLEERYQEQPTEYLADCGFVQLHDITKLETAGTQVYMPIRHAEKKLKEGKDPYIPKKGDSEEVKQWRARMKTDAAKEIYKQRTGTAEFPNAGCRNRGLTQFNVRELTKVKAVTLLQAISHNIQRTFNLRELSGLSIV